MPCPVLCAALNTGLFERELPRRSKTDASSHLADRQQAASPALSTIPNRIGLDSAISAVFFALLSKRARLRRGLHGSRFVIREPRSDIHGPAGSAGAAGQIEVGRASEGFRCGG